MSRGRWNAIPPDAIDEERAREAPDFDFGQAIAHRTFDDGSRALKPLLIGNPGWSPEVLEQFLFLSLLKITNKFIHLCSINITNN